MEMTMTHPAEAAIVDILNALKANAAWRERNRIALGAILSAAKNVEMHHGKAASEMGYRCALAYIRAMDPDNGWVK